MPELKIKIGGDTSAYELAAARARAITKRFAGEVKQEAAGIAGALGAAFGGVAIGAGIKKLIDDAGKLQDKSDQLGISSEKLQMWSVAADQAGSDIEGLSAAVTKMAVNTREALKDPAGDTAKAFAELGVSLEDLKTNTIEENFAKIAEHVRTATVDANLLGNVVDVMGKSGAGMVPVFKQGLEDTRIYNNKEDIAALDELGDAATRFGARWKQMFTELGGKLAKMFGPAIKMLVDGPTKNDTKTPLTDAERQNVLKATDQEKNAPILTEEKRNSLLEERKKLMSDLENFDMQAGSQEEASRKSARINEIDGQLDKDDAKAAAAEAKKAADEEAKSQERAERNDGRAADMRRKNELAGMTDEEKRNSLLEERQKLQDDLNNFDMTKPGGREDASEKALRIEEINGQLTEKPKALGLNAIQSDAMTKIGGFVGGATPAMASELYARDQLIQLQGINRGVQTLVAKNNTAPPSADGWQDQ